jgi:hypothetical protein
MNEITRSSRVNNALLVIQRMNEGLTVKDACIEVGMPRSTFYHILARDHEAIAIFQDMVVANEREQLWMILVRYTNILQKMIEDGLADTTKPRDRLAILKTLDEMRDKLVEKLQVGRQDDAFTSEVLRGPVLRKGISRFAAAEDAIFDE